MIAFTRSKRGYRLNHKGTWYTLTGYYNTGYWQGTSPEGVVEWVKNGLQCTNYDYRGNI